MESDETRQLLIEIRDLQRESLSEYRRVTQRSLDLQQHQSRGRNRLASCIAESLLPVWHSSS